MTRLLCFLSFFVSSYITFRHTTEQNLPDVLLTFGGIYALGYVGGKFADVLNRDTSKSKSLKEEKDVEAGD